MFDNLGFSDESSLSLVPSLAKAEKDTTSDADISRGLRLLNRPDSLLEDCADAPDELGRYRLVRLPPIEIDIVLQHSRRVLGVLFSLSLVFFVVVFYAVDIVPNYQAGTPNVDVNEISQASRDKIRHVFAWSVVIVALAMIWTIVTVVRAKVWARKSYLHVLENAPQPKKLRGARAIFSSNCAFMQFFAVLSVLLICTMPYLVFTIGPYRPEQMLHLAEDSRLSDGWCLAYEQTALPWHLRLEDCAETPAQYFTHSKGLVRPKSAQSLCLHGNATARTVFFDMCSSDESPAVSWEYTYSSNAIQLKGTDLCLGMLNHTNLTSVTATAVLSTSACEKDLFVVGGALNGLMSPFMLKFCVMACFLGVVLCLFVLHALEKGSKMAARYSIPPAAVWAYTQYFQRFILNKDYVLWERTE